MVVPEKVPTSQQRSLAIVKSRVGHTKPESIGTHPSDCQAEEKQDS
jgi:hypothetical protein